jgi:hypothetical protein
MKTAIALPIDQITKFCQHRQIIELSLCLVPSFGMTFTEYSDIDIRRCLWPEKQLGFTRSRPNAGKTRNNPQQTSRSNH